jgi:hypothetical protein
LQPTEFIGHDFAGDSHERRCQHTGNSNYHRTTLAALAGRGDRRNPMAGHQSSCDGRSWQVRAPLGHHGLSLKLITRTLFAAVGRLKSVQHGAVGGGYESQAYFVASAHPRSFRRKLPTEARIFEPTEPAIRRRVTFDEQSYPDFLQLRRYGSKQMFSPASFPESSNEL